MRFFKLSEGFILTLDQMDQLRINEKYAHVMPIFDFVTANFSNPKVTWLKTCIAFLPIIFALTKQTPGIRAIQFSCNKLMMIAMILSAGWI